MISAAKKATASTFLILLCVFAAGPALSSTCSEGLSVPPFLGIQTMKPNLLLMLDNSASMLDLAAAGATGICYDGPETDATGNIIESYQTAIDYPGYFRAIDDTTNPPTLEDSWYVYNLVNGRFEKSSTAADAKNYCSNATGTKSGGGDVCLTIDETQDPALVTAFAARGNFLNWAAASKLDIQKKVLTGGKFDNTNQELIQESRGCLNHLYVKKIGVQTVEGGVTRNKYLTLGIRRPVSWAKFTAYKANSVVEYNGKGYYTAAGVTLSGTPPPLDPAAWVERDYTDLTQIEIFEVTDTGVQLEACQKALEEMASDNPSLGVLKGDITDCLEAAGPPTTLEGDSNAVFNQTTADCWFMEKHGFEAWYNAVRDPNQPNANVTSIKNGCAKVYEDLKPLGLGPDDILKGDTAYACFGINLDWENEQGYLGRCWNSGAVCDAVECTGEPNDPGGEPYPAAEICRGDKVYYCSGNFNARQGTCNKEWLPKLECTGDPTAATGWDEANLPYIDSDDCAIQATIDYCGYYNTPEVIDPSDQEGSVSGDFYNAPAILIETAVEAQLDKPLLTMNGRIAKNSVPTGILNTFASLIRFGAMAFNQQGQKYECSLPDVDADQHLLKDCNNKLDGAQVISYLDTSDAHTEQLIGAINVVKGNTWTPLAEAMYTAIGYFRQDTTMRFNPSDFMTQDEADAAAAAQPWAPATSYGVGDTVTWTDTLPDPDVTYTYMANSAGTSCVACGGPESDDLLWTRLALPTGPADPVQASCQDNNILFITEGASTVDISSQVETFVSTHNDGDTDLSSNCGKFDGSSWLDDLAWYGWQGNMWSDLAGKENNANIRTWVIESAERQTGLTDECQPSELLNAVAENGSLHTGDDGEDTVTLKFSAGGDELQFRADLKESFERILERVSSGSAASVISASRSGEGALYQAIFWPATDSGLLDANNKKIYVKWTGEVHSFLVDADGRLREDTNGNKALDTLDEDINGNGVLDAGEDINANGILDTPDKAVTVYYDTVSRTTKACYGTVDTATGCNGTTAPIYMIKYLWNAASWLNEPNIDDPTNITLNRAAPSGVQSFTANDAGVDNSPKRYIFTWDDLDNDGVVDQDTEVLPFTQYFGQISTFPSPSVTSRGPVALDFGIEPNDRDANEKMNRIINWVRGQDQPQKAADVTGNILPAMRSRMMYIDKDFDGTPETTIYWKLGDIIHSTPITVSRPAENYDQLYRDTTYAEFSKRWLNRRHVVYFGGNDGMLHAVNGGFFVESSNQFCRALNANSDQCAANEANTPVLGEELWAYVPYNILPHLGCLTDPAYEHKYYVDLRPRIFDVQIFTPETACATNYQDAACIHPNGWGTILVGGMGLGGSKVPIGDYADGGRMRFDDREFTSVYFILDITNPEKVPTLLGEVTRTVDPNTMMSPEVELGYSTVIPTMVPMNDGTNPTEWSLILGSGPTSIDGTSDQPAKLATIPLQERMKPGSLKSLRIPAVLPAADPADPNKDFGTIAIPDADSFISDLITVDFETRPEYKADVVYFGTVSGGWTGDGVSPDGWGGKLYRLVTRKMSGDLQVISQPNEWFDLLTPDSLSNPNVLYDPGQPIVTAPTVGTDGLDFWVYFGTGRFFDINDKTDIGSNALQNFYGIREPIECIDTTFGGLNWKTVTNVAPSGPPAATAARGDIGLLPVEEIAIKQVQNAVGTTPGVVGCYAADGSFDPDIDQCLPGTLPADHPLKTYASFDDLVDYITGLNVKCWPGDSPGFDGWSKALLHSGERNLGQATLLSGLLSFSTYIPNTDLCNQEGSGYLYGIYYQTGTSWYVDVFGRAPALYGSPIQEGIFLGAGLSTTPNIHVGRKEGSKAFIQTSVGQIVEIPQPNLPYKTYKSGRVKWRDIEK